MSGLFKLFHSSRCRCIICWTNLIDSSNRACRLKQALNNWRVAMLYFSRSSSMLCPNLPRSFWAKVQLIWLLLLLINQVVAIKIQTWYIWADLFRIIVALWCCEWCRLICYLSRCWNGRASGIVGRRVCFVCAILASLTWLPGLCIGNRVWHWATLLVVSVEIQWFCFCFLFGFFDVDLTILYFCVLLVRLWPYFFSSII